MNDTSAAELVNKVRSGGGWFYWVAALSLINSALVFFEANIAFIFGLGTTMLVDGIALAAAEDAGDAGWIVKLVGFAINLVIVGLFALLGVFARRAHRWAFIVGMLLYALDAWLLLKFEDIKGVLFHAFVLFCFFVGLKACWDLRRLPAEEFEPLPDAEQAPAEA